MFPNTRNYLTSNLLYKNTILYQEFNKIPLGFTDIGARGGVHDIVDPLASQTAILGFEPDVSECERLLSIDEIVNSWARFSLLPVGLYNQEGTLPLYLLSADTNHSLLSPNEKYIKRYEMQPKWALKGQIDVTVDTLDNVLESFSSTEYFPAEFIKLDTQGSEYEILEGALKTLSAQTMCIVSEVQFFDIYNGQKLFSDMEKLLKNQGFSFYGFRAFHFRSAKKIDRKKMLSAERAFYADAIFFKDPLDDLNVKALTQRQLVALLGSATLLGYYDFCLELLNSQHFIFCDPEQLGHTKAFIEFLATECFITNKTETRDLFSQNRKNNSIDLFSDVSKYIQKRRFFGSHDDVLNISPLPKTL